MTFNSENYKTKQLESGSLKITFRAYRNIPYIRNPVSPELQVLNIFIPQAYIDSETINGYTDKTAPIFFPNGIDGYMRQGLWMRGSICSGK